MEKYSTRYGPDGLVRGLLTTSRLPKILIFSGLTASHVYAFASVFCITLALKSVHATNEILLDPIPKELDEECALLLVVFGPIITEFHLHTKLLLGLRADTGSGTPAHDNEASVVDTGTNYC
uniref:Uncharacterized protein n=1 Tax=Anopheles atroparvus TaxID=41427 RepID=A0A182J998_ANOAO